jgi:apolipoprotein N-acyltransferase
LTSTRRTLPFILAAASGILQFLIFPSFEIPWLAPLAVAPLLFALADETRPRRRFLLGCVAGWIFWAGACYWIYDVMHRYAYLSAPVAVAVFCGFFLAKGLHIGVFAVLARPLLVSRWAVPGIAALWVAIEGTHQYLGFTWLLLGNAGVNMSILARLAPYAGVYGLSFAFAMMNAAVALVLLRRPRRELAWLLPLALLFVVPGVPEQEAGRHAVRLVQPYVKADELIDPGWTRADLDAHIREMVAISSDAADRIDPTPPELIVWPEYPVSLYYFDDASLRKRVAELAQKTGAYIILNAIGFDKERGGRALNSAATIAPDGRLVSRYAKIFLVPFGEFVPWPFSTFVESITLESGNFVPGNEVTVADINGHKAGTYICYENAFARGVRRFVAEGAEVLVNISNDSWYGATAARHQHLLLARMRALENSRWLLRATNDGITSIIDPAGRVVASLPSFEKGVLCGKFNYRSELTWFARFGEWFWWLCCGAAVALLLLARRFTV